MIWTRARLVVLAGTLGIASYASAMNGLVATSDAATSPTGVPSIRFPTVRGTPHLPTPTEEVETASSFVPMVVDSMQDYAAGAYVSLDGRGVVIAVKNGSLTRVRTAVAHSPRLVAFHSLVQYRVVKRGWTDLQHVRAAISEAYGNRLYSNGVVGLGIDTMANAVVVYTRQPRNTILGELFSTFGSTLIFRSSPGASFTGSSDADPAPNKKGGRIRHLEFRTY